MGRYTFFPKTVNTDFTVRNIAASEKTIRIFGRSIPYRGTADLLSIPDVSESDIRHSLLKGELYSKGTNGEIEVVSSNIDLTQYDAQQLEFLVSLGITDGLGVFSDNAGVVANVTALKALDISLYPDGAEIFVTTFFDSFNLKKDDTTTADDKTVIAADSGSARWFRRNISSERWRKQTTWHIDPSTGDDENTGLTSGTALETWAEAARRIGNQISAGTSVYVYLHGTISETINVNISADQGNSEYLYFIGEHETIYSGSVTGRQVYNTAAGDDGQITDAAIPVSWTASGLLDKKIVLTSGTNSDAYGWIIKDIGAKTARYSPFWNPNTFNWCEPAIGDNFDIVDLNQVTGQVLVANRYNFIFFQNLDFAATFPSFQNFGSDMWVQGCRFSGNAATLSLGGLQISFFGCSIDMSGHYVQVGPGWIQLLACASKNRFIANAGGTVRVSRPSVLQGSNAYIDVTDGGIFEVGSSGWCAFFENTGANSTIKLAPHAKARLEGLVWGTGCTAAYGIDVSPLAGMTYDNTELPDIQTPGTSECRIGGINKTYAQLPFFNAAKGAAIVDE